MNNQIVLSEEQNKIVHLTKGKHLVLAPPGTGKTELLSHRIIYAIENGVKEKEMVCLTFTNRAAKAIKERIEKKKKDCKVFVGNIHTFCLSFLPNNKLIPQETVLIDEEDSAIFIQEILQEMKIKLAHFGFNIRLDDFIRLNSFIKQMKLKFPDNLILPPKKNFIEHKEIWDLASQVCNHYEEMKRNSNYIDFDDLLTLTYNHLSSNKTQGLKKYSWLQVDEVQDLNLLQLEIIKHISTDDAHQVYFGDYEQSIFSYLGAAPHNLNKLIKKCQLYTLRENFRSPSYLLNVFVDYAKKHLNPHWKDEPYSHINVPAPKNSLKIIKVKFFNSQNEVLINLLKNDLMNERGAQTAILLRTNMSVENFSYLLLGNKIEHFKVSQFDLFRRALIKDIMAFLNCIIYENSRLNWSRIIKIFGQVDTFKRARHLVNDLHDSGIYPADFLNETTAKTVLKDFKEYFSKKRIILFDTETSGLKQDYDDIIQIAALEIIDGKIRRKFNRYLKTDKDLSQSSKVHHITKEFLDTNGENPKLVLQDFLEFVNGDTIAAHNLSFDLNFLLENCKRYDLQIENGLPDLAFDTIDLTRRIYPSLNSYSLEYLINQFNLNAKNTHNALDDVFATFELMKFLSKSLDQKIDKQKVIIQNNTSTLAKFYNNFYPLWKKNLSEFNTNKSIVDVINEFVEILERKFKYEIDDKDKDSLKKLKRHMSETCKEKTLEKNLKKYVPLYETLKEPDLVIGDEKVIVSTIHRAKGLEFTNVIIPECDNGNFPYRNSTNLKEDARTLYVAMTRAKKRLIFISSKGNTSILLSPIEKHFEIVEVNT